MYNIYIYIYIYICTNVGLGDSRDVVGIRGLRLAGAGAVRRDDRWGPRTVGKAQVPPAMWWLNGGLKGIKMYTLGIACKENIVKKQTM